LSSLGIPVIKRGTKKKLRYQLNKVAEKNTITEINFIFGELFVKSEDGQPNHFFSLTNKCCCLEHEKGHSG